MAEFVHSFAYMAHDGRVTLKDLQFFAGSMEVLFERGDGLYLVRSTCQTLSVVPILLPPNEVAYYTIRSTFFAQN